MSTPALLQLLWLSSPALPVGAFSYSEALEAGVEMAEVSDEHSAATWITEQLHISLARSDLSIVHDALLAWRARDFVRIQQLNDWILHTRETQEMRLQVEQMGKSLHEWTRLQAASAHALAEHELAWQLLSQVQWRSPTYPVVNAAIAAASSATPEDVLSAYAFAWAENQVQAAIKSIPLGQSAGQRILARLCAEIPQAIATAQVLDEHSRQAFSPMLALYSAWHETQYSRLFRS